MRPSRPRRRPGRAVAVATLAVLALAGCSGGQAQSPVRSTIADVTVTGTGADRAPQLGVPAGFSVGTTDSKVVRAGQGAPVRAGDVVGAQYVLVNGSTGERMAASAWADPPTSLVMDRTSLPGLREALVGKKVGSEVLVAVAPADGYSSAADVPAQTKVGPKDTLVFLVRLISAVPPRAEGAPVLPRPGLPAVALDASTGEPTITIPPDDPPKELAVQELIRGSGAKVRTGQTVRVQYRGVKWSDGSTFDSSWTSGSPVPFVVGRSQLIEGWDVGLVGQTVGSQVLLVVPPGQGYGDAGNPEAGITGTDTLVFVIDVLAAS